VSAEAKVLRVLLVEDREDDALLVVRLLQREGYAVRWRRVDGRDALREALEGEPWDVVLCDFRMPGFDAYGALEVVRAHDPDMPFVVVSGTVEEDVIVEMLLAEPLQPTARGTLEDALRSGSWWRGEAVARRKDGSSWFALFTVSALREPDGRVVNHVVVAEDVTALKEAEARERELRQRLQQQVERLQALRWIDVAITASLDLQLTLNVVLDQVVTLLGVEAGAVLLHEPASYALRPVASRGLHLEPGGRVSLTECVAGRAVMTGEREHVADLRQAAGKRERALAAKGFVGYCAAPLVARGEAIGVLEVLSRCPLPENSDWWEFLEALAGQAAVAVHNGRLVEELRRANLSLQLAYDATLAGWSRALDLRDRETEGHTQRVTELTVRLAQAMGVPEAELVHIRRGALLHDIGKLGIPDAILLKPGPLSEEEWEVMRRHPDYAFRWLAGIEFLRPALDIPYCHHERWDGGGYPRGLKGEEIPLAARIFAVVDVFDALTSDRPYRKAWSRDEALRYIHEQAGRQFDPKVVEVFLREVGAESVGSGDRPTAGP
jgi:response regulator RpfG family c-di-GMP phosphodiesterase